MVDRHEEEVRQESQHGVHGVPRPAEAYVGSHANQEEFSLNAFRTSIRTTTIVAVAVCILSAASAPAQEAATTLDQAVRLFEQGDYLAAQDALVGIDRAKLNPRGQTTRDDYLSRVQRAITMSEKALRDLQDAATAADQGDIEDARRLLAGVTENDYAAASVRAAAQSALQELDSAEGGHTDSGAVPKPINGKRARALTDEGDRLRTEGRYDEARDRYEAALRSVAGFPEAVAGLQLVEDHERNLSGAPGQSLIQTIRRQNQINWQRTVAEYRDVEALIREHIVNERFDQARQLLVRAGQVVEAGRAFAEPPTKYESLRDEADALAELVETQERSYNDRHVAEIRQEIESQRRQQMQAIAERRAQQVEALMNQVEQHRKDGDLESAINVLRNVQVIDPKYPPARWMMDALEDLQQYKLGRKFRDDLYEQSRRTLNAVEEAKIPWADQLIYPSDWAERSARPGRGGIGGNSRNSRLLGALNQRVPARFAGVPFHEVLERLADAHRLNILPNWNDLKRAGIDRDVIIDLDLPTEISLKRVLRETLELAGGGAVKLAYLVDDEIIKIATKETLDKETYTAIYDVNDLLMEIPNFRDSPATDLTQASRIGTPYGDAAIATPFRYDEEDDDEPDDDPGRAARVRQLINLIQDSVEPASWGGRAGTYGVIREFNGQLVVTQNSSAQQQVGDLLGKLREQRAIQVAVEARFITVTSNYLEEMGIDIDFVLNSGNAGFDFIPGGAGPIVDPVLGSALLLPRQFSRLGFTPNTPALGTANLGSISPVPQPFGEAFLIPPVRGGGGSNLTPIPIQNQVSSYTSVASLGSDVPGSFAGTALGPAFSIFGSFLDNIQVDFLIRATQADARSTLLTAPQLVMFNGQRSWVAVTIQQNFISQLIPVVATGAVAQAPITGTISAGAVLDVQSTVSADRRYVTMTVRPGVTRLLSLTTIPFSGGAAGGGFGGGVGGQAFIQLPQLSSQRVQTTVSVPDGGTLLIGGQKLATETEVESGVPILSKIPLLKRLYSSRTLVKDEQTLLILIKPKIIIPSEQEELAFPSFRSGP